MLSASEWKEAKGINRIDEECENGRVPPKANKYSLESIVDQFENGG